MNTTDKADRGQGSGSATLRAIVAVDQKDRVQCQQPGCGHSVYAAVHVVEEDGRLLVLGSTCFAKRYGGAEALGAAQYGTGSGRKLTDEEREMLLRNTRALLSRFEEESAAAAQAHAARLEELRRKQDALTSRSNPQPASPLAGSHSAPHRSARPASPWTWQKPWTSVALLTASNGDDWVRVQHEDGSQKLVPWPKFDGWETALPAGVGEPDTSLGVVAVNNIVEAIRILQSSGFRGPFPGAWQDVLPRPARPMRPRQAPSVRRPSSPQPSDYNAYAELKGRSFPRK
jgi:hypothetical protein